MISLPARHLRLTREALLAPRAAAARIDAEARLAEEDDGPSGECMSSASFLSRVGVFVLPAMSVRAAGHLDGTITLPALSPRVIDAPRRLLHCGELRIVGRLERATMTEKLDDRTSSRSTALAVASYPVSFGSRKSCAAVVERRQLSSD